MQWASGKTSALLEDGTATNKCFLRFFPSITAGINGYIDYSPAVSSRGHQSGNAASRCYPYELATSRGRHLYRTSIIMESVTPSPSSFRSHCLCYVRCWRRLYRINAVHRSKRSRFTIMYAVRHPVSTELPNSRTLLISCHTHFQMNFLLWGINS